MPKLRISTFLAWPMILRYGLCLRLTFMHLFRDFRRISKAIKRRLPLSLACSSYALSPRMAAGRYDTLRRRAAQRFWRWRAEIWSVIADGKRDFPCLGFDAIYVSSSLLRNRHRRKPRCAPSCRRRGDGFVIENRPSINQFRRRDENVEIFSIFDAALNERRKRHAYDRLPQPICASARR